MRRKKILFVFRRAPFDGRRCTELLDAAMMAAGFGQEVWLAFLDDGVFLLSADREGMREQLDEFDDCDIEHVWVERQSLEERRLSGIPAPLGAEILERAGLARKMAEADIVVSG